MHPKINYWLDILGIIIFLVVAISGITLFFIPNGPAGKMVEFLGILRHDWSQIHKWVGMGMILLIIIHFLFHWKWFVSMTRKIFSKKIN